MKKLFSILLLMFAATQVTNAAQSECSSITDPAERLKCFDAQFPTDEHADDASSNDIIGPILEEEAAPVAPRVTTAPETSATPEPAPAPKAERKQKGGFFSGLEGAFGREDKEVITGTIVDMLDRKQQQMVFQLDNDQIWVQTNPRNLPIKIGDKVTIKSGTMGGYVLRTESGTSTRVSRFKAD